MQCQILLLVTACVLLVQHFPCGMTTCAGFDFLNSQEVNAGKFMAARGCYAAAWASALFCNNITCYFSVVHW
jgi:hypothetical protein